MTEQQIIIKALKYGIFGILLLVVVFGSFGTIGAGERGIKTRMGAVVGIVDQGPYFKIPFIETVHVMNVQTRTISYENTTNGNSQLAGASKDLQDVSIGVVVTYTIDPNKVTTIFTQYSSVENYESNNIAPLIRSTVKAIASQYTAEELITKRPEYTEKVLTSLQTQFAEKDATMGNTNITNIDLSKAFTEAIEAKVTAVQNAEAQKNKLEQVKYEAQQKIETAKAEAESIRIKAQAVTQQGGKDYVQLQAIEKWNGILPTSITPNGTVPFINLK